MARNINSDSLISQMNAGASDEHRGGYTKATHSFALYVSSDGENFTLLSEGYVNNRTKNSVVKTFVESLESGADGEVLLLGGTLKVVVRSMRERKAIDLAAFA